MCCVLLCVDERDGWMECINQIEAGCLVVGPLSLLPSGFQKVGAVEGMSQLICVECQDGYARLPRGRCQVPRLPVGYESDQVNSYSTRKQTDKTEGAER